ncbi:hypothetical protein ACHQM5_011607 [Ranunculus cassubicifolius]
MSFLHNNVKTENDEPVAPLVAKKELLKSSWDDEDADEDDIKESWEDEEEHTPAHAPQPSATKPPKKPVEKKETIPEVAIQEVLDPVAEKLRQQRLEEEADYKSTAELFGNTDNGNSLENFIPKSESDFLEYAELISHKLRPFEKSFHYMGLLKDVMRVSMTTMKAADAKEVASSVTAIANEKIKADKEANAGKKKTAAGKKKQLHVDKEDDEAVVAYDAMDDYEFM